MNIKEQVAEILEANTDIVDEYYGADNIKVTQAYVNVEQAIDKIHSLYLSAFKEIVENLDIISWERIRIAIHEKKNSNNMFNLENIAEHQLSYSQQEILNRINEL